MVTRGTERGRNCGSEPGTGPSPGTAIPTSPGFSPRFQGLGSTQRSPAGNPHSATGGSRQPALRPAPDLSVTHRKSDAAFLRRTAEPCRSWLEARHAPPWLSRRHHFSTGTRGAPTGLRAWLSLSSQHSPDQAGRRGPPASEPLHRLFPLPGGPFPSSQPQLSGSGSSVRPPRPSSAGSRPQEPPPPISQGLARSLGSTTTTVSVPSGGQ